jgi:hypothetical protein
MQVLLLPQKHIRLHAEYDRMQALTLALIHNIATDLRCSALAGNKQIQTF